jgi:GNAT superfamily N-acetyltransferase
MAISRAMWQSVIDHIPMTTNILLATSDEEIDACYPVMSELRVHLNRGEFLTRVKRQTEIAGYRLAYAIDKEVKAVAGFRISESLVWGKYLYVDDLVSRSDDRSKGYGGALFDWLVAHGREKNCDQLHLDSGVQRFDAHRFYLMKRMDIQAHHFGLKLRT